MIYIKFKLFMFTEDTKKNVRKIIKLEIILYSLKEQFVISRAWVITILDIQEKIRLSGRKMHY